MNWFITPASVFIISTFFNAGKPAVAWLLLALWTLWTCFIFYTEKMKHRLGYRKLTMQRRWRILRYRWYLLTLPRGNYVMRFRNGRYLAFCHTTGSCFETGLNHAINNSGVFSHETAAYACLDYAATPVVVLKSQIKNAYQKRA